MNCKECRYLMFDYVDDKLSSRVKQAVDEHIATCAECSRKLEETKERQDELEKNSGMFFYLFKPSGGYKRIFFAGAVITFILFGILTYLHLNRIIF